MTALSAIVRWNQPELVHATYRRTERKADREDHEERAMSIVATIEVPKPKTRGQMAPPRKVFKDRKKEAKRKACRCPVRREE